MWGRCRRPRRRLEPEVSPFARTSAISPTSTRCSPRSSGSSDTCFYQDAVAGYSDFRLFEDVREQSFDKVIAVNFKGAYFTTQKALPLLRRGSSVIITSSVGVRKGWPTTLEIQMFTTRKKFALASTVAMSGFALTVAMGGTTAHAESKPALKEIVIVHGALVDGASWRAVYDILSKDGYHVTMVQEPLTGLTEDIEATKRIIDQQTGPVVLVGHSYGGSVITEAGADPKVSALVYVAALQPDKGEASGQLMSKFAAPNDAMRVATNRVKPDKYCCIPPAKFRETYAADVPALDAQFMADSEQQLAQKAMGAPISAAAWRNKPSYAILTTQDRVVSPELQRWMYQRSGAKITEVSASHAVFVSQPDAVARVIEAAAKP